MKNKTLIVIAGPTAIGKTSLAIEIAQEFSTEIISADSRQFYKEIPYGTAAPSIEELKLIKHHFVGNLSVNDYFNVSMYEQQVVEILNKSFLEHDIMIMVGGSGLYINAVCNGIDNFPDADEKLRKELNTLFKEKGIEALQDKLKKLDPVYYNEVDLNNPKRLLRAIEICLQTGIPYSEQRVANKVERPFNIVKIGLEMPREQLNERIERRLNIMFNEKWLNEAKAVYHLKDNNALNTVGYKEIFKYLDGEWDLEFAKEKILVNTRRYAKRQMTWFKKDDTFTWFSPSQKEEISKFIKEQIRN